MTQLDPLVVDLLDKAFVLAEQIAQMQPEERSVEEHELLVAYRAHQTSRHDLRQPEGSKADLESGSAEALRAEVNLLRTRLANVKQAKSRLFARIIANASRLDTPFTDSPDLSPWDLLKRDMHALNAALRVSAEERSDDTEDSSKITDEVG